MINAFSRAHLVSLLSLVVSTSSICNSPEIIKQGVETNKEKQRSYWTNEDGTQVFREDLDPINGLRATVTIKNKLDHVQSEYQCIEVYDTQPVGKMLVIDGIIQLTEYDNAAYHEMIVHVPMQAHPNPRKVLIIGGGDGGTLSEVVKYNQVEEIVICDIDPMVRQTAGTYFPDFAAAYLDPRVTSLHQDGTVFIQQFNNHFDVIIIDCTDFYGVSAVLARKEFYENIGKALTQDGIVVVQAESLYYDRHFIASLYQNIATILPQAGYYNTLVPTYPSGVIGFVFGSKKYSPTELLSTTASRVPQGLVYYNQEIHAGSFALPNFFKECLQK
ncbi:MAG: polyamine aminopropyltransferase [Candidatus Dependentiae bacterium]|nr:polyamine aminopropyltransferase [Candidatus Dependentiae bacterium]